jgi:hypothetical protein
MGHLWVSDKGRSILIWRQGKIRGPGFDFDAALTGIGTGDQFLAGIGKQKEAETKENDHGCCCDNGERDKVEKGSDIGLRRPGARIRGIGERTRYFGRLGIGGPRRASPRE